MEKSTLHGGLRKKAGRKQISETPQKSRTITLDDATVEILKEYGGGLSNGIRLMAEIIKKNKDLL